LSTRAKSKGKESSSDDDDEMTIDQLSDRNQALREGLKQQLQIFEQYYKVALLKWTKKEIFLEK